MSTGNFMHRLLGSLALLAVLFHLLFGCDCDAVHRADAGRGGGPPAAGDWDADRDHPPTPARDRGHGQAPGDHGHGCDCGNCHFVVPQRDVVQVGPSPHDGMPMLGQADAAPLPLPRGRVCRDGRAEPGIPSAARYILNRALLL